MPGSDLQRGMTLAHLYWRQCDNLGDNRLLRDNVTFNFMLRVLFHALLP